MFYIYHVTIYSRLDDIQQINKWMTKMEELIYVIGEKDHLKTDTFNMVVESN